MPIITVHKSRITYTNRNGRVIRWDTFSWEPIEPQSLTAASGSTLELPASTPVRIEMTIGIRPADAEAAYRAAVAGDKDFELAEG